MRRTIFVSYAHEDRDFAERLEVLWKPIASAELSLWSDRQISPGDEWDAAIRSAIEQALAAVLFISADFLASTYIMKVELPELQRLGVRLIPISVGPSLYDRVDALKGIQWAGPPERHLRGLPELQRDEALVKLWRRLESVLPAQPGAADEVESAEGTGPRFGALSRSAEPGALYGVPPLPERHVPRLDQLQALRREMTQTGRLGIVSRAAIGLHGPGGIGKTVLVTAAAHDDEVRHWFPDGVFWITLGESPDLLSLQLELIGRVSGSTTVQPTNVLDGLTTLRQLFADRRCLLVLDDVWHVTDAQAVIATGSSGRLVLTSRDTHVIRSLGAAEVQINALDRAAARTFLAEMVAPVALRDDPAVDRAIDATGGVVLALAVCAGLVRNGRPWSALADDLAALDAVYGGHPYADVFKSLRASIDQLETPVRDRYRMLGVFPEDVEIPVRTIERLWRHNWPEAVTPRGDLLRELADRQLIIVVGETSIRLHDLQRAFLRFAGDTPLALLHALLLEASRPVGGWRELEADDPYVWAHLVEHLVGADARIELALVVRDAARLTRRIHRDGAYAAELDMIRASELLTTDSIAAELSRWLRLWGYQLDRGRDVACVANTVVARLGALLRNLDLTGLPELMGEAWIDPATAMTAPSGALVRVIATETPGAIVSWTSPRSVTVGGDAIEMWDVGTGSRTAWHPLPVPITDRGSVLSPDGGRVARTSAAGVVEIWQIDPPQVVARLEHPRSERFTLLGAASAEGRPSVVVEGWSHDGRRLLTRGTDFFERRSTWVWDVVTGALIGAGNSSDRAWLSPDGALVAEANSGPSVVIREVASGAVIALVGLPESPDGAAEHVTWAPDSSSIAILGKRSARHRLVLCHLAPGVRVLPRLRPRRRHRTVVVDGRWVEHVLVSWSANSQHVATVGWRNVLQVWDAVSGGLVATVGTHVHDVLSVGWSPDGRNLVTADRYSLRIWEWRLAAPDDTTEPPIADVRDMAWSPDGAYVGYATGDLLHLTRPPEWLWAAGSPSMWDPFVAVAWSRDGQRLAASALGGTIQVREASSGALLSQTDASASKRVAWSPDGTCLAALGPFGDVVVADPDTGAMLRHLVDAETATVLAWSPEGSQLAAGTRRGAVVYDADGARQSAWTARTEAGAVTALSWSPDGALLAVGSASGVTTVAEPRAATAMSRSRRQGDAVREVQWTDDSSRFTTRSGSKTRQFDACSGEFLREVLWLSSLSTSGQHYATPRLDRKTGPNDSPARRGASPSPFGETLIGYEMRKARNGDVVAVLLLAEDDRARPPLGNTGTWCWSCDDRVFAAVHDTGAEPWRGTIWRMDDGAVVSHFQATGARWSETTQMAFAPSAGVLAVASNRGVDLIDVESGMKCGRLDTADLCVSNIEWSPAHDRLAVSFTGGDVWLWDGRAVVGIEARRARAGPVAFSASGALVATADDGVATLSETATGVIVRRLGDPADELFTFAWAPDGRTLAAASASGVLSLWDVGLGRELGTAVLGEQIARMDWHGDRLAVLTDGRPLVLDIRASSSVMHLGAAPPAQDPESSATQRATVPVPADRARRRSRRRSTPSKGRLRDGVPSRLANDIREALHEVRSSAQEMRDAVWDFAFPRSRRANTLILLAAAVVCVGLSLLGVVLVRHLGAGGSIVANVVASTGLLLVAALLLVVVAAAAFYAVLVRDIGSAANYHSPSAQDEVAWPRSDPGPG